MDTEFFHVKPLYLMIDNFIQRKMYFLNKKMKIH